MLIKRGHILITIIILLTIAIFWQFFIKGLYPFPGDYLLGWYEPWKSDHTVGSTITIAHKPVADDIFRQLYPFKILSMDIVKKFRWPLWNPYNGAGMPLMATMHIGYLNPFNVLFLFLSYSFAWSIYIIIQPLLIGICTYLYLRKINLRVYSAMFSTLLFILSGFVITRLIFGDYDYAIIGLPLLLYLFEHFVQNPQSKRILLFPLVIFFICAATQPQIIVYIISFVFLYILYRRLQLKTVLFFTFLFIIGIGLFAVQLIPTLELFQLANVTSESSRFIFDRFLLPIQHFITILIPNYFGNQATYNYWGAGDYIETVTSLGIIPLFFAMFSIGSKHKTSLKRFYLLSCAITILLCIDWIGSHIFYSLPLPILSTGAPSRILFITTFSLCMLAGYGFDQWLSLTKISRVVIKKILLFSLGVTSILLGTFLLYILHTSCNNSVIFSCRTVALRNTILEMLVFFLSMIFFLTYIRYKKILLINKIPILICIIVVSLGLYNSNKFLPFSRKETILPVNPLINALKEKTTDARVFGFGDANIKTNFATYFKFYDPNYYDPLYNKRYAEVISYANTGIYPPTIKRSDIEIVDDITINKENDERRQKLLNLLSIKYFIYKNSQIPKNQLQQKTLWENKQWTIKINDHVLPKTYLVNSFEVEKNQKMILEKLFSSSFDFYNKVLLEEKPEITFPYIALSHDTPFIKTYTENKVLIQTNSNTNNILVLTDNYYPGWKAFVDGKETKIFRANYTFRGIVLPYGKHMVTFLYQPLSLRIGFLISIFSLFIYLLTILFYRRFFLQNLL